MIEAAGFAGSGAVRWRSVLDLSEALAIQKQLAQGTRPVIRAVLDAGQGRLVQIIDCANGRPVADPAQEARGIKTFGCVVQWPEMGVRLRLEALWQIDGQAGFNGALHDPCQSGIADGPFRARAPNLPWAPGNQSCWYGFAPEALGPLSVFRWARFAHSVGL